MTSDEQREALVKAFMAMPVVNDAWTSDTDDWTEPRRDEAERMADVALVALPAVPGDVVAWLDEQITEAEQRASGDFHPAGGFGSPAVCARTLREVRDRLTRPVSPEGDGDGADDGGRGQ